MNGCSALSLAPCFAPIQSWWLSVAAWAGWIEFGIACVVILIVLALVQKVFGWGGVVAAGGAIAYAIGYFRGQHKDSFNPLPAEPQQPPASQPVPRKPTIFGERK